ncbi:hypothetical protein [uncultured Pseudokineococcus sp.]|uniref:hypothetical protein n=1 Tax=uncultured Pseudokineococcus sp. TaxID=1642928 RepID=UPI0026381F91|nr:hypothetical protein [uncultured Pseudokineococcus sp.]
MSRDALGTPDEPSGRADDRPGPPDDVDALAPAPDRGPGASSSGRRAPRPGRGRALALVLAGALGAGGALLAVRAHDAGDVRLLVVASTPDPGAPAEGGLPVRLTVVGTGEADVTVVGGGTGGPGGRRTGRVAGTPVVAAGGAAEVRLVVPGSCDAPPAWEPWLEVRSGGGAAEVVDLRVAEGVGDQVADGPLLGACAALDRRRLAPVSVIGSGAGEPGGVVVSLRNDSRASYRVRAGGGVSGLSLGPGAVELPPRSTTPVVLDVDPPRCAGALRAVDLVSDAGVSVERTSGGPDEGPATAPLDLWVAQPQIALAVGAACAGGQ